MNGGSHAGTKVGWALGYVTEMIIVGETEIALKVVIVVGEIKFALKVMIVVCEIKIALKMLNCSTESVKDLDDRIVIVFG